MENEHKFNAKINSEFQHNCFILQFSTQNSPQEYDITFDSNFDSGNCSRVEKISPNEVDSFFCFSQCFSSIFELRLTAPSLALPITIKDDSIFQ